jgi:hypothetical protein
MSGTNPATRVNPRLDNHPDVGAVIRHHNQANSLGIGVVTSKMDRVSLVPILGLESGNCDAFSHEFRQSRFQSGQIVVIINNDDVAIPAKLGRAVEHAGLSSHKQVPHPLGGKRRKDFEDRVRDQVNHLPA